MRNTSEKTDLIFPALLAARKQFTKVEKDRQNTHLKNKYATLDSVLDMITPPLEQNDLFIDQQMLPESTDKMMQICTTVQHVSGQYISYHLAICIEKQTCQATGSAFTYGRRYALAACFGLSQADDDAELTKITYKDYIKRIEKADSMESLVDIFRTAYRDAGHSEKAFVQEAYEKKKAEFSQKAVQQNGGGFQPANKKEREKVKQDVAPEEPKPVNSEPQAENIDNFE